MIIDNEKAEIIFFAKCMISQTRILAKRHSKFYRLYNIYPQKKIPEELSISFNLLSTDCSTLACLYICAHNLSFPDPSEARIVCVPSI